MKQFYVFYCIAILVFFLSSCSKDDIVANLNEEPIEENDVVLQNSRLLSVIINNNGVENSYNLIYSGDKVSYISYTKSGVTDTTFYTYDNNFIYGENVLKYTYDTITLDDNRPTEKLSWVKSSSSNNTKLRTVYQYFESSSNLKSISTTTSRIGSIVTLPATTISANINNVSENIIRGTSGKTPTAAVHLFKMFVDDFQKIDSMHFYDVAITEQDPNYRPDVRSVYSYNGNQILITFYNSVSTYIGKYEIEIDPNIGKIVSIERFNKDDELIYSEIRNYEENESNHSILFKQLPFTYMDPFESNSPILLENFY